MTKPKRITPNSRTERTLYFDKKDIAALAEHLQGRFHAIFTGGGQMDFQYLGDRLTFFPMRRITPSSARRNLNGLGINPHLIKMAVKAIERIGEEGFPTPDQIRFGHWFRSLLGRNFGKEIKEIVAATPESLARWDQRLVECGRTWENVALSDEAIIRITRELFHLVLNESVTSGALEIRLRRWKREFQTTL